MDSIRPRSLAEYLEILRRKKLAVITATLVVMVASYVAIKRLPNVYESSTFIMVEAPQSQGGAENILPDLSRRLATIRQQVTSRSRLEAVIEKFDLFKAQRDRGDRLDDVLSDMRGQVVVDVNTSQENVTRAFTLSYRDRDPETAQKVAAELAAQLIADNVQAMESLASGETEILNTRAKELAERLRGMESSHPWLLTLREDMPVLPTGGGGGGGSNAAAVAKANADTMRNQTMTIEGLKDQQYKLEQQLAEVEKRIAELRPIVEQQKKASPLTGNPVYGALIAERAKLVGQRDNMVTKQELTEKHPRVQAVNDQIAAINRQIEDLKQQNAGAIVQSTEARDLRQLEGERTKVKAELDVARRAVERQAANPPSLAVARSSAPVSPATPATRDANSARVAQDYLGLKTTYKEVLSKQQDAELKQKTIGSSKVEQYRVLDQANLPQLPVAPNRLMLMAIATLLGVGVGVAFAFATEFKRFTTVQDVKDVEHFTKLPMLAAIPQTLTPGERDADARRKTRRLLLGAAAALVMTFALTGIFLITNLFAMLGKK